MLPEHHHWKPAVQAAAVMLRTPPVDGQWPASHPRPLAIDGVQFWECPRHAPVNNQQRAHTPRKLGFALCCQSNATRAPIANPPNSAQLGGIHYHYPKLHPGPCSSVNMRPWTDRQTHRREWPQYILRHLRLKQNAIIPKFQNGKNSHISQYTLYVYYNEKLPYHNTRNAEYEGTEWYCFTAISLRHSTPVIILYAIITITSSSIFQHQPSSKRTRGSCTAQKNGQNIFKNCWKADGLS